MPSRQNPLGVSVKRSGAFTRILIGGSALGTGIFVLANLTSCAQSAQASAVEAIMDNAIASSRDDSCNIQNKEIKWHGRGLWNLFSVSGTAVTTAKQISVRTTDSGIGRTTEKTFILGAEDFKLGKNYTLLKDRAVTVQPLYRCSSTTVGLDLR